MLNRGMVLLPINRNKSGKRFEVEGSKGKASFVYDENGKIVDIELISRTNINPIFEFFDKMDRRKGETHEQYDR